MNFRRLFCGLGLAACLAAAPAWAESGYSVNVKVTEFDLPNGLHVILCEDHTLPIVVTDVMYKAGSANESKRRTGFAHLFEHLMFCCGSGHVDKGQFDTMLENVGGVNNAETTEDYTYYYIIMPSNALPLALFLESDRMGYLLEKMHPNIVDEQRDVVKNEILERCVNKPYGKMILEAPPLLYPDGHPYSWPIGGSMEDLSAARYEDVVRFYKDHYVPGNASLAIVGDFDTAEARKLVEHWFSDVPKGKVPPVLKYNGPVELDGVIKKTVTDKVKLPMRRIMWHSPASFQKDDAACQVLADVLSGAGYSRLRKRLEYDNQMVYTIGAVQLLDKKLGSQFSLVFMARPGHTLEEIQAVVDEEIARISQEPPSQEEIDLAVSRIKRNYYRELEENYNLAKSLNLYYCSVGQADYFNRDMARYSSVTPQEVSDCAKRYLRPDRRAELTIVPEPSQGDGADAGPGTVGEVKP